MKLNAEEIKAIEEFIAARAGGMNNTAIGAYFGLGDFGQQKASAVFDVLSKIGVSVPPTIPRQGRPVVKAAKRRGRPIGDKDTRPRKPRSATSIAPSRSRLTAEQWQERLSAAGH